jgi:hypothetical protein
VRRRNREHPELPRNGRVSTARKEKYELKRALIATLALAALPAFAQLQLPPRHTVVNRAVAVPLDVHGSVLPVVEVKLNDRKTYRFAIDTSVKCSAIVDKAIVNELTLPKAGAETFFGKSYDVHRLEMLQIGGAYFGGIDVVADDIRAGFKVDGLLGYGLFHDVLVTLDYPKATLRIARGALPAADGRRVLDVREVDGVPRVQVSAAGKPLDAQINTEVPVALAVPASGAVPSGELRVGAIVLPSARVIAARVPSPSIGRGVLDRYAVTFDAANRRVQFS